MKLTQVKPSDIKQAFEGNTDICMCGCQGQYYTPKENLQKVEDILRMIKKAGYRKFIRSSTFKENIWVTPTHAIYVDY